MSKLRSKEKYLNKKFKCNNGEYFTVIEYFSAKNITIKFDDETIITNISSSQILSGKIKNINHKKFTKEFCLIEANKYKSRKEFQLKSQNIYHYSWRNNWLDEICKHMIVDSHPERLIYSYEFNDNSVYIGLTYNIIQRQYGRNNDKNDPVYIHQNKTGLIPNLKILTDFLIEEEASKMEGIFLEQYKSKGWIILNIAKTGSLGGSKIKWTKEACLESANNFTTKSKWQKNGKGSYGAAKKYGPEFFKKCCKHMIDGYQNKQIKSINILEYY